MVTLFWVESLRFRLRLPVPYPLLPHFGSTGSHFPVFCIYVTLEEITKCNIYGLAGWLAAILLNNFGLLHSTITFPARARNRVFNSSVVAKPSQTRPCHAICIACTANAFKKHQKSNPIIAEQRQNLFLESTKITHLEILRIESWILARAGWMGKIKNVPLIDMDDEWPVVDVKTKLDHRSKARWTFGRDEMNSMANYIQSVHSKIRMTMLGLWLNEMKNIFLFSGSFPEKKSFIRRLIVAAGWLELTWLGTLDLSRQNTWSHHRLILILIHSQPISSRKLSLRL